MSKEEVGGEGEEEEAQPEENELATNLPIGEKYVIIGTLKHEYHKPTEDISQVIKTSDENYNQKLLQCGYIIFDASTNLEVKSDALDALQGNYNRIQLRKKII